MADKCRKYLFVLGLLIFLALLMGVTLHLHALEYYGIHSFNELVILGGVGILAGILGGLLGMGGGVIMLPALDFLFDYSSPAAIGTTLFAVIFTVLSGAYGHFVRDNTKFRVSLIISAGGIAGILIGSMVFTLLLDRISILNLLMGVFFLVPGFMMTRESLKPDSSNINTGENDCLIARHNIPQNAWLAGLGIIVGLITGTLGLGGGFLLVPGLTYGLGMSVHLAVGSTMLAAVPITVAGGVFKLFQGLVIMPAAIALAAGTVIGAQGGAAVIKHFPAWLLKLIFGLYFFYIAVRYIWAFFA